MISNTAIIHRPENSLRIDSRNKVSGSDNGCSLNLAESAIQPGGDGPNLHARAGGKTAPVVAEIPPSRQYDPRPYLRHQALAFQWCERTRRSTSDTSIIKMMHRYTADELCRFLVELQHADIPADLMVSHGA